MDKQKDQSKLTGLYGTSMAAATAQGAGKMNIPRSSVPSGALFSYFKGKEDSMWQYSGLRKRGITPLWQIIT